MKLPRRIGATIMNKQQQYHRLITHCNHKMQTNLQHREEETQITWHKTELNKAASSVFTSEMIAKITKKDTKKHKICLQKCITHIGMAFRWLADSGPILRGYWESATNCLWSI